MFTVEQRDALREWVLRLAHDDARIVAGAAVGSLAVEGGGDRFSDLDLTFAVVDHVAVGEVLDDWAARLRDGFAAAHLVDVERGSTVYRVFLLPDALQFDLSMTPAAEFRPAGPRFRLLFGETAPGETPALPPLAAQLFGWGVIYALHARACIERGRVLQAEHYVGAVRDHALSLACLRHGLPAVQARGHDDLPAETHARLDGARAATPEPDSLRAALGVAVGGLVHEGRAAKLEQADAVAERLGADF